ncbi:hypothetical protein HDU76_013056 [Blyttiomyces sp. JEL0837]|nr:hypothetical protein HDU76_013056 [Blyttiomyces sp. JEL0837]
MTTASSSSSSQQQHNVFITGASAGIGKNLALAYAAKYTSLGKPSTLGLILTARRISELEKVKTQILSLYPSVRVYISSVDVTNSKQVFETFKSYITSLSSISVVVANSGIFNEIEIGSEEAFEEHKKCIETNVIGLMATVNAAVQYFKSVGKGQVVAIGSVAAYRAVPKMCGYAASKAAVGTYITGLKDELEEGGFKNIKVTFIQPGYIETDMAMVQEKT